VTPDERIIDASLNPEILISARESRGRTQAEVATAAGVTQGVISKAENGIAPLSTDQIDRIAEYLGFPASLFGEPDRIRSGASACLYHRKRKTLPAKLLTRLQARMYLFTLHTDRLLRDFDIDTVRQFHTMDLDDYNGSPTEVARAVRSAWRVAPGPIHNLTTLIESAGGAIMTTPFGTRKLFGMSCWSKVGRPFFYLNEEMPTADLRWTLAHELGHLTMHAGAPNGDPEEEADEFAAEFLCPRLEIRPQLLDLSFARLPNLKAYWRVSMKTLIRRAQKLEAIPARRATSLYKQYSARRYSVSEPVDLTPEPPTLFREAVRIHFDEHDYSVTELAGIARMAPEEFEVQVVRGLTPKRSGNVVRLFGAV
jgi:Zn-dependent peptidase ImmA (M78 family)/transcriptional regulator with XRE-family HTH domain